MNRSLLPLATALLHATTAAPASEAGTLPALPHRHERRPPGHRLPPAPATNTSPDPRSR
ncbi:hypothetical protein QP028_14900 [Corynebacterium suedekumii]|nr:hypothetical protein QP028_14900 [Corynebacterium suedekumii]